MMIPDTQLLYRDRYVSIFYTSVYSMMEHHWTIDSYEMTEDEFKKEQLIYLDFAEKLKPKVGFVNSRELLFTITPSIQNWMNETLHPRYVDIGLKKAAFLMSSDFFSEISIRQIFEDYLPFQVGYFDDEKEAKSWLWTQEETVGATTQEQMLKI
ncbi:MAG: hypothetical protein MUE81_22400 [Thermoflexibacter sp.]|nr:hypothetical protein [Thermoflexibacter sp.]